MDPQVIPHITAYLMDLYITEERTVRAMLVADWQRIAGETSLDDYLIELLEVINNLEISLYRVNDRRIALVMNSVDSDPAKALRAIHAHIRVPIWVKLIFIPDAARNHVVYAGPEYGEIAPHAWMMQALNEAFEMMREQN